MSIDINALPDNPEQLKEIIVELHRMQIESQEKIKSLAEKIKILVARLFGKKSERRDADDPLQGKLFDESEHETEEVVREDSDRKTVTVKSYTRSRGGRKPIPVNVPRIKVIHDLSDEEKIHSCGKTMKCIGEERSERLCHKPEEFYVEVNVRRKYACECEGADSMEIEGAIRIADMPPQILPKSIASPSLLAHIIVSKFNDALPFYRQEKIFARRGIDISRQNLCSWAMELYERYGMLGEALKKAILSESFLGMDETPVQVLSETDRANTTKSYMWVARGGTCDHPLLLYQYFPTRSAIFLKEFLAGYHGIVQCDGFSSYEVPIPDAKITLAGCWAHVRRKFIEAETASKDALAKQAIDLIRDLYAVERFCKDHACSMDEIRRERNEHSRPIIANIKEWLDAHVNSTPPHLYIGKAIRYTLSEWPKLQVFLDHPEVPIDNNLVENAIRPFVVGRKNWLFSGNPRGASASAFHYSIIETMKANGIEPYKGLLELYEKLPCAKTEDDYRTLLTSITTRPPQNAYF